jgi:hypothetical protein
MPNQGTAVALGAPTLTAVPWFGIQVRAQIADDARARTVVAVARACRPVPGKPTVVFYGDIKANFGYRESIFLTVVQRAAGEGFRQSYGLPRDSAEHRAQKLLEWTEKHEDTVRVVVGDEPGRQGFAAALRVHPEYAPLVTLVDLDDLLRTGRCAG